jgi:hypothetical protein
MLIEAEYSERTGVLNVKMAEFIGDVIQGNILDQKDAGNGFTRERTMRRVAAVPATVFRQWQKEFERIGGKNQIHWTDDWRKFRDKKLAAHPEFRTVDKMLHVTPNAGSILVK